MRTCSLVVLVALGLVLSLAPASQAHTPIGGLAVAVSPDGATLVAGGDNRTLYVLDAKSLEVRQRVALDTTIWDLAWSKDGSRVLVEDTDETLHAFDTATWQIAWTQKKHGYMAVARDADVVAVRAGAWSAPEIRLLSMKDGATQHTIKLGERQRVAVHGVSPDGKRVAVLFSGKKDEAEPKKTAADRPKDLKGAARAIWALKHDGNMARYALFQVGQEQPVVDTKSWYTSTSGRMVFSGDVVWVVNYQNVNGRFDAEGKATAEKFGTGYNYGIGASADDKLLLIGGLKSGARVEVATGKVVPFRIPDSAGWPEYFKRFSAAPDGTAYAATTSFKVHRIGADGKVTASVVVR